MGVRSPVPVGNGDRDRDGDRRSAALINEIESPLSDFPCTKSRRLIYRSRGPRAHVQSKRRRRLPGSDSFTRRALPRWHTRLGIWIDDVGVDTIVDALKSDPALRCSRQAIVEWLQGHQPKPERALALVALSRELKRPISLEAIYSHRKELEILRREGNSSSDGNRSAPCRER